MKLTLVSLLALIFATSVAARPTLYTNRQFVPSGKRIGTKLGQSCSNLAGEDICFNGDVAICQDGELIVSQSCTGAATCLQLPVGGSAANIINACATATEQTALFAIAFGGIDNLPSK
ncbi:hypothetical protein C8J57DRAFT_1514240 [Mycena rebaudengoi]|nr:hypothetical protein C8J57DRAFT_1514240 [Mycena rebaudengoi]